MSRSHTNLSHPNAQLSAIRAEFMREPHFRFCRVFRQFGSLLLATPDYSQACAEQSWGMVFHLQFQNAVHGRPINQRESLHVAIKHRPQTDWTLPYHGRQSPVVHRPTDSLDLSPWGSSLHHNIAPQPNEPANSPPKYCLKEHQWFSYKCLEEENKGIEEKGTRSGGKMGRGTVPRSGEVTPTSVIGVRRQRCPTLLGKGGATARASILEFFSVGAFQITLVSHHTLVWRIDSTAI